MVNLKVSIHLSSEFEANLLDDCGFSAISSKVGAFFQFDHLTESKPSAIKGWSKFFNKLKLFCHVSSYLEFFIPPED